MNKPAGNPTVEISVGELIDKISILEIKSERLTDAQMLANVRAELEALTAVRRQYVEPSAELDRLGTELKAVNSLLWDIENTVRGHEREQRFDAAFIDSVRSIYRNNDRRAALKRRINELTGSRLKEEKQYTDY